MKPWNYMARVAMAVMLIVGLGACSKKKNGSVASTPASTCSLNAQGQLVNSAGQLCSAQGQTVCPATGYYMNQYGQQQACTPGQYIYTQTPYNYPYNPYPNNQYVQGCQQYYYQYGVPYVPFILNGQYVCVRYDLVTNQLYSNQQYYTSYYQTPYYSYGWEYYYAYPPYSGSGCNTSIDFGGSWGSIGICF